MMHRLRDSGWIFACQPLVVVVALFATISTIAHARGTASTGIASS